MYYVYILLCNNYTYYVGSTDIFPKRFINHKNGKGGWYTKKYKPFKLVYSEPFNTKTEALNRENQLKR